MTRRAIPTLFAVLVAGLVLATAGAARAAPAAPAIACEQQGVIPAFPPVIPTPLSMHECTAFSGVNAAMVGEAWCRQAAQTSLLGEAPPKVTRVATCPSGALARCDQHDATGTVTITRHYYVVHESTGGMAHLKKLCESGKRTGAPVGVFTVL